MSASLILLLLVDGAVHLCGESDAQLFGLDHFPDSWKMLKREVADAGFLKLSSDSHTCARAFAP